jgi:hypothetical protein
VGGEEKARRGNGGPFIFNLSPLRDHGIRFSVHADRCRCRASPHRSVVSARLGRILLQTLKCREKAAFYCLRLLAENQSNGAVRAIESQTHRG